MKEYCTLWILTIRLGFSYPTHNTGRGVKGPIPLQGILSLLKALSLGWVVRDIRDMICNGRSSASDSSVSISCSSSHFARLLGVVWKYREMSAVIVFKNSNGFSDFIFGLYPYLFVCFQSLFTPNLYTFFVSL